MLREVLVMLAIFAIIFLAIIAVVGFVTYWRLRKTSIGDMPEITEGEWNGRKF